MNFSGIIAAFLSFISIGIGFLWVIKLEYYVGAKSRYAVYLLGLITVCTSMLFKDFWISSVLGIFGGTVIWGATELSDQEKRAKAGQFPVKPGHSQDGK